MEDDLQLRDRSRRPNQTSRSRITTFPLQLDMTLNRDRFLSRWSRGQVLGTRGEEIYTGCFSSRSRPQIYRPRVVIPTLNQRPSGRGM